MTDKAYRAEAKWIANNRYVDLTFLKNRDRIHKELRHATWLQIMSLFETADMIDFPKDFQ